MQRRIWITRERLVWNREHPDQPPRGPIHVRNAELNELVDCLGVTLRDAAGQVVARVVYELGVAERPEVWIETECAVEYMEEPTDGERRGL